MESFEQFVAVAMESEGLVVSEAIKFPVTRQTRKATPEVQTHGYEVDLVGARADLLVLATVKSFFGSVGVKAAHVMRTGGSDVHKNAYKLLNDQVIRDGVVRGAGDRYGYPLDQVELRLYVGKFAGSGSGTRDQLDAWAKTQIVGAGPIKVYGLDEIIGKVQEAAASKTYRNNPVLVTMKVLNAARLLKGTDTSAVDVD